MSIMNFFSTDTVAATIERATVTNVNDEPVATTDIVDTIDCLYWEGPAAQALVSERFRDRTTAVIGVYPGVDIQENDTVRVQGIKYHALSPDNIASADEVKIVGLEVFA